MSLTEFSYQLCDSYHLNQNHSCKIQLGGTDQLGNLMSGHKFIHKCTNARYHSNLQALELMRDAELQELFRDAPFHELLLEPGPTILDACRRAEDILRGPKGYCMVSEGTVWINHSKTDQPRKDPSSQNKRSHSSSNEVTPCPSLEYTPRKASPRTQT
ncbi:tyrosine--tRNA ligase, mitochondrial-like isoform X2 [Oncorhynchus keta]|uniref:tyrosine--tRNA ligase, mitochondrial-like isoform X2 n=1 Tax=Oncorhynchus keta TaxID=8018 RepID=UPI0015F9FD91|nr:tyrosine--tRNA ligase, mitochondrial-like isoform X2 [Oncorhynchus keta]